MWTPLTVIFVERTERGALANQLRQKEKELNEINKKRIKEFTLKNDLVKFNTVVQKLRM